MISRVRVAVAGVLAFVLALGVMAVSAAACGGGGGGGGKEPTTLTTTLSGESKEGGEITVLEGAKVKDKAKLSGKNVSKATGKVKYDVYSNSSCTTLVTAAGEGTVSGESVTASSEESLEAGKTYYWQATYEGNETNDSSTSSCTSEVLNVKAATSLSTTLSGESKEGSEITVLEGSKVKDKATLSGTNHATAGGKVTYKVYSNSGCTTLVKEAGEVTVSSGSVPNSSEEELEGGKTYYWKATYNGDSLHEESNSGCSEILNVKAKTTLTTKLAGESKEGEELTVLEGAKVTDNATLGGTNHSSAGGKVTYDVYSNSGCTTLVKEAGEVTVSSGTVPASSEEELEAGKTYYWKATYNGDSLHEESNSGCSEILNVKAKTTLTTKLAGESKEGEELTVLEGAKVKDKATLTGTNASTAGGKVTYKVYSDSKCETLVATASEETVSSGSVPASSEEELEAGKTYYWKASYNGDSLHEESNSGCSEVLNVKAKTTLATTLSGEGKEGTEITVLEGSKVKDKATLSGTNYSTATGKVAFNVYSDSKCEHLVTAAGEETIESGGKVPTSSEEELEGGKTYYWQASYEGDKLHQESTSSCDEIVNVKAKTTLTTTLSGEGKEGSEIAILEGTKATDKATLTGTNASTAGGTVTYKVYSDSKCETLVANAGEKTVSSGSVPASSEEELESDAVYYWKATYNGDSLHQESSSGCSEILTVKAKTTLSTTLAGEGAEGAEITVLEGARVTDNATLGGSHSTSATGKVTYKVYSDSKCEHLVATAGEVSVSFGSVPASGEEELEGGKAYYWEASYGGDSLHAESSSGCSEILTVKAKTTLSTTLAGEGKEGTEITVLEGSKVTDNATLSGTNHATAGGKVTYKVYSDSKCEHLVTEAGEETVSSGTVPASSEEELEGGKTYYWKATYGGDSLHQESNSGCSEILTVKAKTTLTTKLDGESKEGEELTILEGSKAKDKATLSGTNSTTATGKVTYKVYSDSKCEHLLTEAGEETVSGGTVPASNEEELEGGKTYYWKATYNGDTLHQESNSRCTEILNIKAKTTLSTSLSGEGNSGAEIETQPEVGVTDTATVHGANASTATGTVVYRVYSDSACKEPVAEGGEATVTGGTGSRSSEVTLQAGEYYWQAEYSGDHDHQSSLSSCGSELSLVKVGSSLSTELSGEGQSGEALTVAEGQAITDSATLSGSDASMATGTVAYKIYSNSSCTELVANAGEVTVVDENAPPSLEETLPAGTYYWQATYDGDTSNQPSTSACGSEVATVQSGDWLTTSLSAPEQTGTELEVAQGTDVHDTAVLHGKDPSTATGTVTYRIYSDEACEDLISEAGKVSITDGIIPTSDEEALVSGTYYWEATYSGDSEHAAATSPCTLERLIIHSPTTLATELSSGEAAGTHITTSESTTITDQATISGTNASAAEGSVEYDVYSDSTCETLVAEAGTVSVEDGVVPPSVELTLSAGTYYWRATYSGDGENAASTTSCGEEISTVKYATALMTTLVGGTLTGPAIVVSEGTTITDQATLSGPDAAAATGEVTYRIYSDSNCKELVAMAGKSNITGGSIEASSGEKLAAGIYYWQASYPGDSKNVGATSACGSETAVVTGTALTNILAAESEESGDLEVLEGTAVTDHGSLAGEHLATAGGEVTYKIFNNDTCTELVREAGKVSVSKGEPLPSFEEILPVGEYYWSVEFTGYGEAPSATSKCDETKLVVKPQPEPELEWVEFTGDSSIVIDHPVNAAGKSIGASLKINEFAGNNKYEWKSTDATGGPKNWPIVYPMDTTMKLEAQLKMDPLTERLIKNGKLERAQIVGTTKVFGKEIEFKSKNFTNAELKPMLGGKAIRTGQMKALQALPAEDGFEKIEIDWDIVAEIGGVARGPALLDSSQHNLYLTYAKPITQYFIPGRGGYTKQTRPLYFTLLDIAGEGKANAPRPRVNTEGATVSEVWGGFTDNLPGTPKTALRTYNPANGIIGEAKNAKGEVIYLKYWPEGKAGNPVNETLAAAIAKRWPEVKGTPKTLASLLNTATGKCGAWAEAFQVAIGIEGIAAQQIQVLPPLLRGPLPNILVKKWTFNNIGGAPNGGGEVTRQKGIAGQGVDTPWAFFEDHALTLVELKAPYNGFERELYDPSYASGPFRFNGTPQFKVRTEAMREFQEGGIAGYCNATAAGWLCEEAVATPPGTTRLRSNNLVP